MKIRVRYFAVLRDRAGVGEESVETSAATARELVDELIQTRHLELPSTLIRPAVNGQFVDDSVAIHDGDEVVLIPPVAGG